jgi:hypothetical protein
MIHHYMDISNNYNEKEKRLKFKIIFYFPSTCSMYSLNHVIEHRVLLQYFVYLKQDFYLLTYNDRDKVQDKIQMVL